MTEPRCHTCGWKIGWSRYIRGYLRCERCCLAGPPPAHLRKNGGRS